MFLEKVASKVRIIGIGKNKAIRLLKGGTSERKQRMLVSAALRQKGMMQGILNLLGKQLGSKGKAREHVKDQLLRQMSGAGTRIGGTIAQGRKGSRSYIDLDMLKEQAKRGGPSIRNVVHHEEFHRKVPVLGRSEILAHLYGGFNQTKNKRYKNFGHAARDLKTLVKVRPGRFGAEVAAFGGAGYGAKKGLDKLRGDKKGRGKDKKPRQRRSSAFPTVKSVG